MTALRDYAPLLSREVGEDNVSALLDYARLFEIPAGTVLVRDQGPLGALYLLLEGRLSIAVEMAGHAITLGELDPGNWVGEVALFSGSHTACSTVQAREDCKLLRLEFTDFFQLEKQAPEAACRLTHTLVTMLIHRLRATVNDPILDPEGQLLMLGDLSMPLPGPADHPGLLGFMKRLLGVD